MEIVNPKQVKKKQVVDIIGDLKTFGFTDETFLANCKRIYDIQNPSTERKKSLMKRYVFITYCVMTEMGIRYNIDKLPSIFKVKGATMAKIKRSFTRYGPHYYEIKQRYSTVEDYIHIYVCELKNYNFEPETIEEVISLCNSFYTANKKYFKNRNIKICATAIIQYVLSSLLESKNIESTMIKISNLSKASINTIKSIINHIAV